MANEENLIPFNERTEIERREIATKAGIRSGEVRREKRLLSMVFAEMLEKSYKVKAGEAEVELSGAERMERAAWAVIDRNDASTASMMKLITEATEGKKIKAELVGAGGGPILTHGLNAEEAAEFKKRISELHPELTTDQKDQ